MVVVALVAAVGPALAHADDSTDSADKPPWTRSIVCPVLYTHEIASQVVFRRFVTGLLAARYQPTDLATVDQAMIGRIVGEFWRTSPASRVNYVAYPSGTYDPTVLDAVARFGFRGGFTTRASAVLNYRSPFTLPRISYDPSQSVAAVIGRIKVAGG